MNSLDDLFRTEILEDMEDDTVLNDDDSMVEAVMSGNELDLLDEADNTILEDKDLDDFLNDKEDDDIDDMIEMEDLYNE